MYQKGTLIDGTKYLMVISRIFGPLECFLEK